MAPKEITHNAKLISKTAILVAIQKQNESEIVFQRSLDELRRLAETAEFVVIDKCFQKKDKIEANTYVGSGFLRNIQEKVLIQKIDFVIFDDELSPSQIKNIERDYGMNVLDRTELILTIFYLHAKTTESRLEIRLAELQYEKPRLRNSYSALDRLGGSSGGSGGLASRGVGETKLELDRRTINNEIIRITRAINRIERQKATQSQKRITAKKICLVGYTNVGKSTLFNNLTNSNVYVQDQLFATLASVSRKLNIFPGCEIILSDTVGFISKLPHHLIASFTATLKEVKDADLLLHVIDISDPDFNFYHQEVNKVLAQIGVAHTQHILVYNKLDQCDFNHNFMIQRAQPNTVFISAQANLHIDQLLSKIQSCLFIINEYQLSIPLSEQKLLAFLHENTFVIHKEFTASTIEIRIKANLELLDKFHHFIK